MSTYDFEPDPDDFGQEPKHIANDECHPNCNYSKAISPRRATWLCAACKRDFSMEYLLWYEATHPNWNKKETK